MNIVSLRNAMARCAVNVYRSVYGKTPRLEIAPTPDGPWTPVYGDYSEENLTSQDIIEVDTDQRTRSFFIPRQYENGNTGALIFPPEKADTSEDLYSTYQIRIAGQSAQYAVQTFKTHGNGALFEFSATNYIANMIGIPRS